VRNSSTKRIAKRPVLTALTTVAVTASLTAGGLFAITTTAHAATTTATTPCSTVTAPVTTIIQNFTPVETAANHDRPDGRISRGDLSAAGRFMNGYPLNVSNAALQINDDPGFFELLDTAAHGGNQDGFVSLNDLQAILDRVNANMEWLARINAQNHENCKAGLRALGK
jgi:hypothetical protein